MRFDVERKGDGLEVRMMFRDTVVHSIVVMASHPIDYTDVMRECLADYRQSSEIMAEMFERRIPSESAS